MSKKDRDYDVIIKGIKSMETEVSTLRSAAKLLGACAASAEATLKDNIAKKDLNAVRELVETINNATASGEIRIKELQRKVEAEKQRVEELEGR